MCITDTISFLGNGEAQADTKCHPRSSSPYRIQHGLIHVLEITKLQVLSDIWKHSWELNIESQGVQKGYNIAVLRPLFVERSHFKVALGWCLENGFVEGGFPPFPVKTGSLCLNCLCKQCALYWTHAFFLTVWNFVGTC